MTSSSVTSRVTFLPPTCAHLATLFDQHHRHAFVEVLARGLQHVLAGARIELNVHRRTFLRLAGGGVGELVTGGNHLALQQHRRPKRVWL